MSYIPDCRTDEVYNYDNLNRTNQHEIKGYDIAMQELEFFQPEDFINPSPELKKFCVVNKDLVDEIICNVLERLEISRNEFIVSLIENQ